MTAEIVELDVETKLDIPVERILRKATEVGLDTVVVVGYDSNGDLYFCASSADGREVLWLLERAKHTLMTAMDEDG